MIVSGIRPGVTFNDVAVCNDHQSWILIPECNERLMGHWKTSSIIYHDDDIKFKRFLNYWPFGKENQLVP